MQTAQGRVGGRRVRAEYVSDSVRRQLRDWSCTKGAPWRSCGSDPVISDATYGAISPLRNGAGKEDS